MVDTPYSLSIRSVFLFPANVRAYRVTTLRASDRPLFLSGRQRFIGNSGVSSFPVLTPDRAAVRPMVGW